MPASQTPSAEPTSDQLFHPVTDAYGKRLALVFGNHAEGGECPFYLASRCNHCDIGMGEGTAFDLLTNRQRLEWYQSYFRGEWASLAHLVIYNSGSALNPVEMPFEFLQDVLEMARRLGSVRVVSLDSRESFVTTERMIRIASQLRDDQSVRIILGIESADDHIRNVLLEKAMSVKAIQRAFDNVAEAAEQVGLQRVGLDVNILVGGPGTTAQSAILDASSTAMFTLARSRAPVDFNLHPYYPSSRGLKRFPTHPRCSTPVLIEAIQAIAKICEPQRAVGLELPPHERHELVMNVRSQVPQERIDPRPKIFIGLNDEGHDTVPDGRLAAESSMGRLIQRFNATQDIGEMTEMR